MRISKDFHRISTRFPQDVHDLFMFVFVCLMAVMKCPECSAPGTLVLVLLVFAFKKLLAVTLSRICVFGEELGPPYTSTRFS